MGRLGEALGDVEKNRLRVDEGLIGQRELHGGRFRPRRWIKGGLGRPLKAQGLLDVEQRELKVFLLARIGQPTGRRRQVLEVLRGGHLVSQHAHRVNLDVVLLGQGKRLVGALAAAVQAGRNDQQGPAPGRAAEVVDGIVDGVVQAGVAGRGRLEAFLYGIGDLVFGVGEIEDGVGQRVELLNRNIVAVRQAAHGRGHLRAQLVIVGAGREHAHRGAGVEQHDHRPRRLQLLHLGRVIAARVERHGGRHDPHRANHVLLPIQQGHVNFVGQAGQATGGGNLLRPDDVVDIGLRGACLRADARGQQQCRGGEQDQQSVG